MLNRQSLLRGVTWAGLWMLSLSVVGCGSTGKKITPNETAQGYDVLHFELLKDGKTLCHKVPDKKKIEVPCHKNGVLATWGQFEEIVSEP